MFHACENQRYFFNRVKHAYVTQMLLYTLFAYSNTYRTLLSMHHVVDFALYDLHHYADPYYIKYDNVSSIARQIYRGGWKEYNVNL